MKKGITPVVATVLLITVTFAAAGTLYTMVEDNVNRAEETSDTDLPLNVNSLKVDQCYTKSGRTFLVVRNSARDAMNASRMTLLVNGSIESESNYRINKEIVNGQRTFTVNMSGVLGRETTLQLTNGQSSLKYSCYNL